MNKCTVLYVNNHTLQSSGMTVKGSMTSIDFLPMESCHDLLVEGCPSFMSAGQTILQ
jgi:hypothetical protein